MRIGRVEIFQYKQTSETGYLFALRAYRYGVHNSHVKEKYGSGFVLSLILFDYHLCLDVKLTLPTLRETRRVSRAANI